MSKKITISIPNIDQKLGEYIYCTKEDLQKAYLGYIGKTIEFDGGLMKVVDVRLTKDYIFMDLESPSKTH